MYFKVLRDCSFAGVAYKAGDMLDIADPEAIANLRRELDGAIETTTPEKMAQEKAKVPKPPEPKPPEPKPVLAARVEPKSVRK